MRASQRRDDCGWLVLQRITLDFGLRGANQHFVELLMPEIGGAENVHKLSWAAAGLAVRDDFAAEGSKYRAGQLAHAVESLVDASDRSALRLQRDRATMVDYPRSIKTVPALSGIANETRL